MLSLRLLMVILVVGVLAPASASASCALVSLPSDTPGCGSPFYTPSGPATIIVNDSRPSPAVGLPWAQVLVGWRVTVGEEHGNAGPVRVRVQSGPDATSQRVGDPVTLPAEPGTYTFPAPHVHGWVAGIDQTVGGHAIVNVAPCRPELGKFADPCQLLSVDIFQGDPPPGPAEMPDEHREGASLAIDPVYESDKDGDLRGDQTEDRTDLKLTTTAARDGDGNVRVAVTIANGGPLTSDLPVLAVQAPPAMKVRWDSGCGTQAQFAPAGASGTRSTPCMLPALTAGQSRTLTLVADARSAAKLKFAVQSEGADLRPEDDTAELAIAPLPALKLTAARRQALAHGIATDVRLGRPGRARVTAAFAIRGRTVRVARTVALRAGRTSTVTLKPHGAVLRSLRRGAARGPLKGTIVARRAGGPPLATARITLGR